MTEGKIRRPTTRILANGQELSGVYAVQVDSNNHFSADRFTAACALSKDSATGIQYWSSEANLLIDIQVSLNDQVGYTSLIQGYADELSLDPVSAVAKISGRDFASNLIEAQTLETFSNRTSSEIANIFAQRHALTPCVTATSTPVGRFYRSDRDSVMLACFSTAIAEWDLLAYLARQEGFDLFVFGRSLYFQPACQTAQIDLVLRTSDVMELKLERALTRARDTYVTVRSWNTQQQAAVIRRVGSTVIGMPPDAPGGDTTPNQEYSLVYPNLTSDRADTIARQRLTEVTRHERTIEFVMPGELSLTSRSIILLTGTETAFDQAYYVDSIEREFRLSTGFLQRVRASNSSPREFLPPATSD